MEHTFEPVMIEANIKIVEETEELKKSVASIIEFPESKTPDLLYFSGIFVSSGENLNNAYFMPSEIVKAASSIDHKALDIEHKEDQIVGHIYDSKFVDKAGNILDVDELSKMNKDELDKTEMDVYIAGILYKSRFTELAKEVAEDKWMLSMETYFQDYDIKIGNVIMSRKEAEALGIESSIVGKVAKLLKEGKEVAEGGVTRVLRDLLFSGCGLVKHPANPRSVILETAKKLINEVAIVIDLDKTNNTKEKVEDKKEEEADINIDDVRAQTSVGICVSYKKRVIDATFAGPETKILHKDWCALYEKGCTSFPRDVTDPNCLRRQAERKAKNYMEFKLKEFESRDKRNVLLSELKIVLAKNKK